MGAWGRAWRGNLNAHFNDARYASGPQHVALLDFRTVTVDFAYLPVCTKDIRVHERAGRRCSLLKHRRPPHLISSRAKFSPSRGSLPSSHNLPAQPNLTTSTPAPPQGVPSPIRDKHLKKDVSTETRPPATPSLRYRAHCCAGAAQVNTRGESRGNILCGARVVGRQHHHGSCTLTPSDLPYLSSAIVPDNKIEGIMRTGLVHW
jgi:hypothetical protein